MNSSHMSLAHRFFTFFIAIILLLAATPATPAYAAALTVDRLDDSAAATACTAAPNDCSLRGAITNANGTPAADTISFSVSGTITLTINTALPNIPANRPLTIDGGGNITISGNSDRIMRINQNAQVTLNNLIFTNGNGADGNDGGAIFNEGTLAISGSTFTNNSTSNGDGGAIQLEDGSLTISGNSIFSNNTAPNGDGGAIFNNQRGLTVSNTSFTSNSTTGGDGGAIYNDQANGTETLTNVAFTTNSARRGGAIFEDQTNLSVISSTFTGNTTNGGNNQGGAIFHTNGGTLTITTTTFLNNVTGVSGGAIYLDDGSATITLSTFNGNIASQANNGNQNAQGGAIYNNGRPLTIGNSTFTNNIARTTSATNTGNIQGGAIYITAGGTTTVRNVTLSGNSSTRVAGSSATLNGGNLFRNGGTLSVGNTILNAGLPNNCSGTITNAGNNADSAATCGFAAGNSNINPSLSALTGTPAYFPLNTGSPAIDTGSNALCLAAPVNNASQNSLTRPIDGNAVLGAICDIGSYEAPAFTTLTVNPATGIYGGTVGLTATLTTTAGGGVSGKTINFTLNGSPVGSAVTNASGIATLASASLAGINVGVYPTGVGASFAGDVNYAASSATATLTVNQATSTVTVTCPASQIYTGSAITPCTAQATGVGMSPVDVSASLVYSNNTNVGTASANASWAGDANHIGNTGSSTFDITKAASTVTVTCPASQVYTGSAITPCTAQATGVGMSPVDVTASLIYSNNTNVGTASADASWIGDLNHTGNTGSATFDITKATSTVTVTCPASQVYTGAAITPCTAEVTGAGMSPIDVTASLIYSNNTNVGTASADASWTGDANHTDNTGSSTFDITKATSTVTVTCPASQVYTGSAITPCTAQATGVGMSPIDVTASLIYSNNTNVGTAGADANWAGDANHTGNSGSSTFDITEAASTVTVSCPASQVYTGSAITPCTAQATGVGMSPIDVTASLIYSNNTNVGTAGANASWAGDLNHIGNTGSSTFNIAKANASIVVTPYNVTYDGSSHTATGSATGVLGESLSGLNLSGTIHTNAGTYNGDPWTFTDVTGNYNNASGTVNDQITKAASTVTVSCPASQGYTGSAITPCTAQATGVGMSPVDVTASLVYSANTNVGTANANASWAGDANHTGNTGSSTFAITQASSTVTVTCPASQVYTSAAITPCTAQATGVGMGPIDVTASLIYSNNTNIGTATANANWAGDLNHTGSTGSSTFDIVTAATTTTITSDTPDPSAGGQTVTVQFNVTVNLPGAGTPTGNVTVTDGVDSCTATVAAGQCNIVLTTDGIRTLIATYAGDTNFNTSTSAGEPHTVDAIAPTLLSINRADADPTNAASVDFTVTFSESVSGVSASNFTLVTTGSISGASITTVSAGPGATRTVTVNTGSGDGTIGLNLVNNTGIADLLGNSLVTTSFTGQVYTIIKSGPIVSIGAPSLTTTSIGPVDFPITITGATSVNLTNADITLNATGTANGIINVTNGTTNSPTITISGITGSGTLGISIAAGVATDALSNPSNVAGPSTTFIVDNVAPQVASISTNNGVLVDFQILAGNINLITVTFSKDVYDDPTDTISYTDDATNPANYLLVRDNQNDGIQTTSCDAGIVTPSDIAINVDSASYVNGGGAGPFISTLVINSGLPLSNGQYRLLVCGTTSIGSAINPDLSLAGDGVNSGTDFVINFRVAIPGANTGGGNSAKPGSNFGSGNLLIPVTGFRPNTTTILPEQPASSNYSSENGLEIEIPSLGVRIPIVGVELTKAGWNIKWLGNNAGYLDGSAYPTLSGNSVITGHVTDANGKPGPFAYLNELKKNDLVIIHFEGQKYIYQIREDFLVNDKNIQAVFKHEEYQWITLVTCETYSEKLEKFLYRRLVRAVLISVIPEK